MARFEDWRIIKRGDCFSLSCTVYDDTWERGFPDGARIVTGPISGMAKDASWIRTATSKGVKHVLGNPAADHLPLSCLRLDKVIAHNRKVLKKDPVFQQVYGKK